VRSIDGFAIHCGLVVWSMSSMTMALTLSRVRVTGYEEIR